MQTFTITDKELTLADLQRFLATDMKIEISEAAQKKIKANRAFLEKKIAEPGARYYGINTGFGALCDVEIAADQLPTWTIADSTARLDRGGVERYAIRFRRGYATCIAAIPAASIEGTA